LPAFWTLPTAFLSGAAAAAGIAVINSIGNLASFAGPLAMGWIKDHTATGIVLTLGRDQALQRAPRPLPE
jgi:ACS family tartrate transporter-like MFS transporter